MAKRRKKTGVVSVDFSDVEEGGGGFRIPEGDYRMKVVAVNEDVSESDNDMLVWDFVGLEGRAKKKKFRAYTTMTPESLWKLYGLLKSLGVDPPKSAMDIDLEEMVGLELMGVVQDDEYRNKITSKIMDWYEVGGSKDDDEDDDDDTPPPRGRKKKPVKAADDEDEDDDDDPAAKRRARRAARRKAQQEEENGDDDDDDKPAPRKGSKAKKGRVVKVTSDEVKEMDEEELTTLVEKHSLDVELDDYRTLTKKRAAVIGDLEEKDLLDE